MTTSTMLKAFYQLASAAFDRCYNPKNGLYPQYGGKGVTVEFRDRGVFADYLKNELPGYEPGKALVRINNDLNFAPGNLMWED